MKKGVPEVALVIRPAFDSPEDVRELFAEYTAILVAGDPAFQGYLDQQNYEHELTHLEEKYGEPAGRLYLAEWDGAVAGCVALHRLSDSLAELKRLYVRPAFRGRGIGRALTERIIGEARLAGYQTLQLDTQPFLPEAIRLYERLGFEVMPGYNDSPLDTTIYMKMELDR